MDLRFIVVDDDPLNNMLCTYLIKKAAKDADVKCFEYPAEGLSFISSEYSSRDKHTTILFLDINMPEISGWDFLEEFDKLSKEIREQFIIYIVSSSVDAAELERAKANIYVKEYLSKPLNKTILEKICEELPCSMFN